MKLYFAPQTRATRTLWMLEETGAPFELVTLKLREGEHRTDSYRAIHPLAKVPALVDGEQVVFESAAICLYLGDRFPEAALCPPFGDPLRGQYYQWCVFSVASLETAVFKAAFSRQDQAKHEKALTALSPLVGALEGALADQDYLLETGFSTADVLNASIAGWALDMGAVEPDSRVAAWVERTRARPAHARMLERSSEDA